MSLQHIKLKPLFYLKSKNRSYFTKISKLQQKWEQNSSPISCEQNRIGEMEKEKTQELQRASYDLPRECVDLNYPKFAIKNQKSQCVLKHFSYHIFPRPKLQWADLFLDNLILNIIYILCDSEHCL